VTLATLPEQPVAEPQQPDRFSTFRILLLLVARRTPHTAVVPRLDGSNNDKKRFARELAGG
jgi:hypothetical protein